MESDVENVDPFEIINQANKQAEVAKAAPKQKVIISRAELKINIQIRAKRKRQPLLSQPLLRRKRRTTNVQKDDETDEAVDAVAHVASDDHAV